MFFKAAAQSWCLHHNQQSLLYSAKFYKTKQLKHLKFFYLKKIYISISRDKLKTAILTLQSQTSGTYQSNLPPKTSKLSPCMNWLTIVPCCIDHLLDILSTQLLCYTNFWKVSTQWHNMVAHRGIQIEASQLQGPEIKTPTTYTMRTWE